MPPVQTIEVTEPHNVLLFICEVHPEETSRDANDFVQLMQLDPNMPFSEPKLFRHWSCVADWANGQALAEANAMVEFQGGTVQETIDSDMPVD